MKPSKRLAGVVALATVAAGVSVIVGTSAANAAASGTLYCNTGGNGASFGSTWTDTNTFTLSPASVLPGGTVTATWTSAAGLVNGSPAKLVAKSVQVQVLVSLSGAMTGNVLATSTPNTYPVVTTNNGVALGAVSATTTFTAAGSGTVNATVPFVDYNAGSVDTYCGATQGANFPKEIDNGDATNDSAVTYIGGYTPNYQSPTGGVSIHNYPGNFSDTVPCSTAGNCIDPLGDGGVNFDDVWMPSGLSGTVASASFGIDAATAVPTAVTGQAAGVTSYGRASVAAPPATNQITVSGTGWDASQAPTANFDGGAAVTSALSTDTSGNLTGTINIPVAEAAGVHTVNVSDSAHAKSFSFTILGTQTLVISPTSGGAGTVVNLTGANWNPSASTILAGVITSHAVSADGQVTVTSTNTGNIPSTNYTVNDPLTTYLGATQAAAFGAPIGIPGGNSIYTAFSFSGNSCTADTGNTTGTSCSINQTVLASVLAGNLSMYQGTRSGTPGSYTYAGTGANPTAGTIQLCSAGYAGSRATAAGQASTCAVPASTTTTPMTGQLNQVTVTDLRGGVYGWSLTSALQNANFTTLTASTGVIPAADFAIAGITCAADASVPGSAPGLTVGTGGSYGTAQSLCIKAGGTGAANENAGGSTSGQYLINTPTEGMTLTVPAFQIAGNYSNTLVITLT